jgi:hypothetical protein
LIRFPKIDYFLDSVPRPLMSSNPYQPSAPVRADVGPPLRDLGALTLLITIVFAFMAVTLVTTGVATSLLVNRPGDVGLQGAPDPVVAVVALRPTLR